jgi:hypothetical protein
MSQLLDILEKMNKDCSIDMDFDISQKYMLILRDSLHPHNIQVLVGKWLSLNMMHIHPLLKDVDMCISPYD